jgi:hypothetical protein
MMAITVCQPFAYLITLPESDRRAKRVENRTWQFDQHVPLAIHAGQSRAWFAHAKLGWNLPAMDWPGYAYGCVVAVCQLVACVDQGTLHLLTDPRLRELARSEHCLGPWCWFLDDVRPLANPIRARGSMGLWRWQPPAESISGQRPWGDWKDPRA